MKTKFNDGRVVLDFLKVSAKHELNFEEFINELKVMIEIMKDSDNILKDLIYKKETYEK